MKNILVISPHPDDESIGCGGSLNKHIQEGDEVEVVFLSSGEKGGHGIPEAETIRIRESESINALSILHIPNYEFWKETDGSFDANDKNISRLLEKIKNFNPDIIYVTHEQESHPDHQQAARLVKLAITELNQKGTIPTVWMYEVWTPIQQLDLITDITPFIEIKRKAIQAYASQCEVLAFDDAIIGLNRYRGEMHCWPEGEYAEVFKLMKI